MILCIPVAQDLGLASKPNAHFGSTPLFLLYDTNTRLLRSVRNENQHHAHGMCSPIAALAGHHIDAVIVGGIGMGAIMKLRAMGATVYLGGDATIEELIRAFGEGALQPIDDNAACAGHAH
jgi:predicted Fe-Mo cluster-binding NifX family protein